MKYEDVGCVMIGVLDDGCVDIHLMFCLKKLRAGASFIGSIVLLMRPVWASRDSGFGPQMEPEQKRKAECTSWPRQLAEDLPVASRRPAGTLGQLRTNGSYLLI